MIHFLNDMQVTIEAALLLGLFLSVCWECLFEDINNLGKEVGIVVYGSVGVVIWGWVFFAINFISTASLAGLVVVVDREGKRWMSESSERDAGEPVADTEV